jgi:hypothetical protein
MMCVQLHHMDVFGNQAKFFANNLNGDSGFVLWQVVFMISF